MRTTILAVGLLLASVGAIAQGGLPSAVAGQPLPSLAPMLDRVTPGVVNIATYTTVQVRNPLLDDPFFRRFFNVPKQRGRRYQRTQSAGSGVVIDADKGYIVTNNHVVQRADEISVTLSDGRDLKATLIGVDTQVDLAVLQVKPEALTEVAFADSANLRVGDFVVAIGNPFGLSQTVTSGIVSALGRSGLGIEGYEDLIQTDASINPGNSGGALVDLSGRLVGVNTAIISPSGGNVGIGFAIPANMVNAILEQLIEHGEVKRGFLGLSVQSLNIELAKAFGVAQTKGVVVVDVQPASVASRAGLAEGDIITKLNNRPITKVSDFHAQEAVTFVGDELRAQLIRSGKTQTVRLKIKDTSSDIVPGKQLDPRLAGVNLQSFSAANSSANSSGRSRNRAAAIDAGVLVGDVEDSATAWHAGLRAGDVIVSTNRTATVDVQQMREVLRKSRGRQLLLRVYRNGQFGYIAIR